MSRYFTELRYVYFVYIRNKLVYIGRSGDPIRRLANHRCRFLKGHQRYRAEVYGPFEKWQSAPIEAAEILKRKHRKHFLATTTFKHDNFKEISVKNHKRKTVLYFGERGKIQKVVSKHLN